MRFEVDWLPEGPNVAPEERATVADLRIFVADSNACVHEQPRRLSKKSGGTSVRKNVRPGDAATVSLYPLAEEIVFNWWRLFGGRDSELALTEGRGGYALPDVRLAFNGTTLAVRCLPIDYANPEVRFTVGADEWLRRADAESALAELVEKVVRKLVASGLRDSGLQLRWQRVRESRQNADETAFCEATGALSLDPYDLHDADAEFVVRMGAMFRGEPLQELLAGLPASTRRTSSGTEVMAWLRNAEARSPERSSLPALAELRKDVSNGGPAAVGDPPWRVGYRCARLARRRLNLGAGERLDVAKLARRLGGDRFEVAASVSGLRAVVANKGDATHVHLRAAATYQGVELFALARALGDAVANPPAERSVVNDLHQAARQATGRAFAAEFLAPIDEILSLQEDGKDLHEMAAAFGVAEEVVGRQQENQQHIASACAGL